MFPIVIAPRGFRTLRLRLLVPLLALAAPAALAQKSGAPESRLAPKNLLPAEARDFRLAGPFLHPSEWRSAALTPADFNGDGRLDFLTVSNEKSVLELFLSEPKSEERFRKETITLDALVTSASAIDANGDGRMDLLLTLQGGKVSIMYQSREGRLQPGTPLSLEAESSIAEDIDGDGATDVLLQRKGVFQLLRGKGRGIELDPSLTFYTTTQPAGDPLILDLDMDGKRDIAWMDATSRDRIFVRLQSAEGAFPSEFVLSPGPVRWLSALHLPGARDCIVAVQDKTRQLVQLRLAETRKSPGAEDLVQTSQLHLVPFDPDSTSDKFDAAVADIDGDGRLDLVVSNPKNPSIRVVRQQRDGTLSVNLIPSLEGIEQVTALPGKAGDPASLLLFSRREKAAGIARGRKGSDGLSFPRLLPALGAPRATCVVRIGGKPFIVALGDSKDNAEALRAYELKDSDIGASQPVLPDGNKAEGLKLGEGNGLAAMDLNQDGREDIVLYSEFAPAALLLQDASGRFAPATVKGGVLEGLLTEMTRGRLVPAKLDTEAKPVTLAVKGGFVRAFALDEKEGVKVFHQFNARPGKARLVAAAAGRFRSAKNNDIALLDIGNRVVTFHGVKEDKGGYEEIGHADIDAGEYRSMAAMDLDGDERDDLLLFAQDRVAILYTRPLNSGFETIATAKTPVEDGAYSAVWTTQIFPGGAEEIVALEARENVLEFFTAAKDADGKPALLRFHQFKAFEVESSMAGRVNLDGAPEPRQVIAADLEENRRPSILALTHDFVIRYTRDAGK